MATKKELEELIIRVDERTKVIPEINKHLVDINRSIEATNVKLAKTDVIAKQANKKADSLNRWLIYICIIIVLVALGLGIPGLLG